MQFRSAVRDSESYNDIESSTGVYRGATVIYLHEVNWTGGGNYYSD
jgi:hypothetical protein